MSSSTTGQDALPDPAPGTGQGTASVRTRIDEMVNQGCELDDPNLISEALSLNLTPIPGRSQRVVKDLILNLVWFHSSTKVLTYLLTQGSDVLPWGAKLTRLIDGWAIDHRFPKDMVEILLAHGWDINARETGRKPLLWLVVRDGDAVSWCLDHGADPFARGQRSFPDFDISNAEEFNNYLEEHPWSKAEMTDYFDCPPLLQAAASQSTVATFELLRSKGAAMSWRVLHMAVASAIFVASQESSHEKTPLLDKELARTRQERLAMVRHLVDTLKLDVNALDCPPGRMMGNFYGRPLHYVAIRGTNCDCRPVTWFLMDRGADPELLDSLGNMSALALGGKNFKDAVNEWRLMKTEEAGRNIEKARHEDLSQEETKT